MGLLPASLRSSCPVGGSDKFHCRLFCFLDPDSLKRSIALGLERILAERQPLVGGRRYNASCPSTSPFILRPRRYWQTEEPPPLRTPRGPMAERRDLDTLVVRCANPPRLDEAPCLFAGFTRGHGSRGLHPGIPDPASDLVLDAVEDVLLLSRPAARRSALPLAHWFARASLGDPATGPRRQSWRLFPRYRCARRSSQPLVQALPSPLPIADRDSPKERAQTLRTVS